MAPTIFREHGYRFFFFSREESRMHVHIVGPDGEAKFWIEPIVELAVNKGLSQKNLRKIQISVEERCDEIRQAWQEHFS